MFLLITDIDSPEEWFVPEATTLTTSWARYSVTIPVNTTNVIMIMGQVLRFDSMLLDLQMLLMMVQLIRHGILQGKIIIMM